LHQLGVRPPQLLVSQLATTPVETVKAGYHVRVTTARMPLLHRGAVPAPWWSARRPESSSSHLQSVACLDARTTPLGIGHPGNYRQAGACYRYAMDVFDELGDRYEQTCALTHLGQTYQAAADSDTAREAWRQALDILLDPQHPDADAVQARLRELDHPNPGLRLA